MEHSTVATVEPLTCVQLGQPLDSGWIEIELSVDIDANESGNLSIIELMICTITVTEKPGGRMT